MNAITHVVIVNYNTADHVAQLLASQELAVATQIVVVDNVSSAEDRMNLRDLVDGHDNVRCVWMNGNRGFAAGVHAGIDFLTAQPSDRVWILNPDTLPRLGSRQLLETALEDGLFEVVSPVIVTGEPAAETIWFAGGDVDVESGRTKHSWHGHFYETFRSAVNEHMSTGFVSGAAPMMTIATWHLLNGFDRSFFMYWEDADFSLRAAHVGMKMGICSDAVVWHAVGAASSASGKSALYYYYMHRNRLRVMRSSRGSTRSLLTISAQIEMTKLLRRAVLEPHHAISKVVWSIKGIRDGFRREHYRSISQNSVVTIFMNKDRRLWNDRYQAGKVPSPTPYGLGDIAQPSRWCTVRNGFALSDAPRIFRRALGSGRKRVPADQAAVTWDERHALRVWATTAVRSRATGVIWAVDRLEDTGFTAWVRRLVTKQCLRTCTTLWVLSRAQLAPLAAWLGPGAPAVEFIKFGIDTDFFYVCEPGIEQLVVSFGRDRDRDIETAIRAFHHVLDAVPNAKFVIQGPRNIAAHPNITIVEELSHTEIRSLYHRASVVAIATRPNTHVSGMTVALEGMSVGRPIVITATPGMDDYVLDGTTGTFFESGDDSAMADAITSYLVNEKIAGITGQNGAEHVRRNHRTTTMTHAMRKLLHGQAQQT